MSQKNNYSQVLICDDDPIFHLNVKSSIKEKVQFHSAYHGDEAIMILKHQSIDVLLLDIHMRKPKEGLRYIQRFLELDATLSIIIVSAESEFNIVREAMKKGASDYLLKNANLDELVHTLLQALERRNFIQRQNQQNFETLTHHKQNILLGETESIKNLRKIINKVRKSLANVMIIGETGTGKELVARQLRHELPNGTLAPFLAIDSSTIQESTAESILFGHERGAFTGADKTSRGLFEEANNGIIYFDEIANMPLSIQPKLLRVLQEKEITRLGSSKRIQLDFRVICATNQDLESMSAQGKFKFDLLQRLDVIPIRIPTLKERKEDIPILINYFLSKFSKNRISINSNALEILLTYSWPGNVRELSNLISFLTTMIDGDIITEEDIPIKYRSRTNSYHSTLDQNFKKLAQDNLKDRSFYQQVSDFEANLLREKYNKHSGSITNLAKELSMDRSHLYTKLKQFGIIGRPRSEL